MGNTTSFLSCFCFAAACGAATAQQLYKTVGPDGRVTFSDRPKVEEKSKLSVMHSYTLRPVEPAQSTGESSPAGGKLPVRREAGRNEPAPVVTLDIEESIVRIMGMSAFGGRFEIFCNGNEADAKAFAAATLGWSKRNTGAVEHQKRVLTVVLSPSKRAELIGREETLLAEQVSKMSGRSAAARKEWCDTVVADLNSGRNDINHPGLMAVPIVAYKAK